MAALEEELRMPILPGEGPIGIILAPSRELVRQTYDVVEEFCQEISKTPGYPSLRSQLVIGGESVKDQVSRLQSEGIHCVVATPGRLRDILKRKAMRLDNCRFICLDEADRLLGTCHTFSRFILPVISGLSLSSIAFYVAGRKISDSTKS